jgi:oligopeptide transport system substrate-binding protein
MTQTFRSFAAIVFAAVVLLISASAGHAEKIFHRGNGAEPYSLDPHRAISVAENKSSAISSSASTRGRKGEPIFRAAESAETAPDGLSWTFKIPRARLVGRNARDGQRFAFALRRVLDPKTAAEYASVLYPIKNALKVNKGQVPIEQLGVRAGCVHTLVIELENPTPFCRNF